MAQWMSDLLGHPVLPQRGWEYLKGLRLRLRIPRPEHQAADADEQETWKKKLRQETAQLPRPISRRRRRSVGYG